MEEQEYQSKFFLTGFLLASALIIVITMVFVMFFIASLISAFGNLLIALIAVVGVGLCYFYALHRFGRKQSYSRMVFWYVLTICLQGLLISSLSYLSIVGIIAINYAASPLVALPISILLGYIVVTEVFSVAALLSASFELREIEQRKFLPLYLLTVITLFIIAYVFKNITFFSPLATVITSLSILISAFYILDGIKYGALKVALDSVEDRYRFVISALAYSALAPIQIPRSIINRLTEKENRS